MREVSVHPDCEGGSHWIVEYFDSDNGCYVATFDGPLAEQRARDYLGALKSGQLKVRRLTMNLGFSAAMISRATCGHSVSRRAS
jgi:hypothetical protein